MKSDNEAEKLLDNNNKSNRDTALDIKAEEKSDGSDFNATLKMALFEGFATFLFMSSIYFCKGDVTKFIFGMWVILTVFGKFSGAHVNPAITLGFYVYEGHIYGGLVKLLLYWVMQFFGAFLGAIISRQFYKDIIYVAVPIGTPASQVMFSEFFFTGLFLFVILFVCSKTTAQSKCGIINCAVIVGWFYFLVNAGANISGAAYNPAILTVLNMIAYETADAQAIKYLFMMIGAQLAGVIVFALIFKYILELYYESKFGKKE